jgi:hypothetical protein
MTSYTFRPPASARYTRVMNLAAKLDRYLTWNRSDRTWTTTDPAIAAQMRKAGAEERTA